MNRIVPTESTAENRIPNVHHLSAHGDSIDAFLPPEMAKRAEDIGVVKANLAPGKMFLLAILAGAFIALGAAFATTVTAGSEQLSFGVSRLLGGVAFSLGLILVVVAGAELFTGNNLTIMAFANGKVRLGTLLRGWIVVYLGNFVGAMATAILVLLSFQYEQGEGVVGENVLRIANTKCRLGFFQAIALGILCNGLVCLAIWLCYSARSTTDKIVSIFFPITAFVACGFEHSVANMYFIPLGLFVKQTAGDPFWSGLGSSAADFGSLTWSNFFVANLLPVTIGNIVGGAVMVGLVYWFIHLRGETRAAAKNPPETR